MQVLGRILPATNPAGKICRLPDIQIEELANDTDEFVEVWNQTIWSGESAIQKKGI